jgi:hypothetical protein
MAAGAGPPAAALARVSQEVSGDRGGAEGGGWRARPPSSLMC